MQFIFDGEVYKVIRVTGPSHNLLGISFSNSKNSLVETEILQISDNKNETIFGKDVKEQVLLGLNEINEELDTNYKIKKIQFVISDTPSDIIYKELTKEIIKRIENQDNFKLV